MSAYLMKSKGRYPYKILHGSDSDVSFITIIKMGSDLFIVVETFVDDGEINDKHITHKIWNREELDKEFNAQYGTPMQYISKEDYDDFVTFRNIPLSVK